MILLRTFFILIIILFYSDLAFCQTTPGFIYKQSTSNAIKAVLDPNGDGYVSVSSTGFSGTDYGSQSELKMIPLPIIGVEPTGDVSTGGSGSHTDIVSNTTPTNQSAYILYKKVGSEYYLIFRFRVGGASTASKGYSVLFDTDGVFGNQYPSKPDNPGFEKEVVMETGPSGRIAIYNHNNNGATLASYFSLDEYAQRSIALTTVDGNADYFYDFCVPYPSLDLSFDPVRTISVTITSANSGLVGTKADFNGINDKLYGNDPLALAKALIGSCPAVPLTSMVEGYSFPAIKSLTPTVNGPLNISSTSISGSSGEDNGAAVQVFKNGTLIGTATVSGNSWTLSSISGLALGDKITAKVTGVNKSISDESAFIEISKSAACYTNRPFIEAIDNGRRDITIRWINPSGTSITSNSVTIKLYDFRSGSPVLVTGSPNPAYIASGSSSGTVKIDLSGVTSNQSDFANGIYYATATVSGCESRISDPFSASYTAPSAPSITTTQIEASASVQRTVAVKNNHTATASISLYIGQSLIAGPTSVSPSGSTNFNYTGFTQGDSVYARASLNNILSNRSNIIVVDESSTPSATPVITGKYDANDTQVSGSSSEPAGTVIKVYSNATLLGSTTVNAGGFWTLSGLTLTTGQSLTATADAVGKAVSALSTAVVITAANNTVPSISGPINAGSTSISGTGGSGTITVYVDGAPIGTVSNVSGSWTLSGISGAQLYRGGVVTATNTISNVEGATSSPVSILGVTSFEVTDVNGNALTSIQAGQSFNIKIRAKDGNNLYSGFIDKVNITSSNSGFVSGSGITNSFSGGVLASHSLALTTAGANRQINVVNVNDPTATGTTSITVSAGQISKIQVNQPADITPGQTRAAYQLTLTDSYGNAVNASSNTTINLSSNLVSGSFFTASVNGSLISTVQIPAGSNSVTVYFNASSAATYTVSFSSNGLTSASDEIVAGFIWQGDISNDWGTGGNWEGNTVPTINDEVIVANKITYWPALDNNKVFKDLYIASNATLDLNGYTLTITGKLSGTGKFIGGSTSSLSIEGSGNVGTIYFDQSVDGTSNKLQSLTMNLSASGSLVLGNNLRIGTLNLTEGLLDIADANLFVGTITGGKSSSYVQTSGIGLIKKSITTNSGFIFQVGNSSYNPIKITNKTNVNSEEFGVQVIDEVYSNGNGRGSLNKVPNNRVIRTWEITKASSGPANGSGVDLEFYWNDGETNGGVNINNLYLYHYERGNGWGKQNGIHARDNANKKITYSGYTGTFSPFSLQEESGALPVSWLSFTATKSNGSVILNWSTASEQNTKDFDIQYSTNGITWNSIGVVAAAGFSNTEKKYNLSYSILTTGTLYFRIKQNDLDGKSSYSKVVSVHFENANSLLAYPNPVNDILIVHVNKEQSAKLISANGAIIWSARLNAGRNEVNVSSFPRGTYVLHTETGSKNILLQ